MTDFEFQKKTIDSKALHIKKLLAEKNSKGDLDILSFLDLVSQRHLLSDVTEFIPKKGNNNGIDNYAEIQHKYIKKVQTFEQEVINYMQNENLKECLSLAIESKSETQKFAVIKKDWKKFRKYFMNNIKLHDKQLSRNFVFLECLFRLLLVWHEQLGSEPTKRNLKLIDHLIGYQNLHEIFKEHPETKQLLINLAQRQNHNYLGKRYDKDVELNNNDKKGKEIDNENTLEKKRRIPVFGEYSISPRGDGAFLNEENKLENAKNIEQLNSVTKKLKKNELSDIIIKNRAFQDLVNKKPAPETNNQINNELEVIKKANQINEEINFTGHNKEFTDSDDNIQETEKDKALKSKPKQINNQIENEKKNENAQNNTNEVSKNVTKPIQSSNSDKKSISQKSLNFSNKSKVFSKSDETNVKINDNSVHNSEQNGKSSLRKSQKSLKDDDVNHLIDYDASFQSEKTSSAFSFDDKIDDYFGQANKNELENDSKKVKASKTQIFPSKSFEKNNKSLDLIINSKSDTLNQQLVIKKSKEKKDLPPKEQKITESQKLINELKKGSYDYNRRISLKHAINNSHVPLNNQNDNATPNNLEQLRELCKTKISQCLDFIINKPKARNICNNIEANLFCNYYQDKNLYIKKSDKIVDVINFITNSKDKYLKNCLEENTLEFEKLLALANTSLEEKTIQDEQNNNNLNKINDEKNCFINNINNTEVKQEESYQKNENSLNLTFNTTNNHNKNNNTVPTTGESKFTVDQIIEGLKEEENQYQQEQVNKLRIENSMLKKTQFEYRLKLKEKGTND